MVIQQDFIQSKKQKDETIVSVIKRLFGEHITSRLIRMPINSKSPTLSLVLILVILLTIFRKSLYIETIFFNLHYNNIIYKKDK